MKIKNSIISLLTSVKSYWRKPPEGRYMSFREIISLSVGGIGVKFIVYCVGNMILSVGNTLIGNTIGIDPSSLYIIYIIGVLSGFPLTALRAKMIDNTRSMKGKYRPYILSMGLPTVILGTLFIFMPYEDMTMRAKCITVLAYNIAFQFFYNFMNDSYDSLINVLSPNSVERSDVCSIKAVIENFSPSIANIFLPIAAKLITGDNTLYDLRVYRALYPPMLAAGFLISLLVYKNTEEKIVQAKTHNIEIRFSDAFRAVARNKYFWIISLAGWLGFLEGSFNSILGWMYNYQSACTPGQYAVIIAIAGNASFWPNLIAPYFIRRFGKKKILVATNLANILFILLMLPVVRATGSGKIIWLLLICNFVNQFITSLGHLMNPSLNADIRDYQQYITGERIDGMFAAVGLIGNVITLLGSFILPLLYEKAGLNATVAAALGYGTQNVYDVLFNREYFVRICSVLVIASVFGAVMNVIPFFFYDLTETKQAAMVKVLKLRAYFEDRDNDIAGLSEEYAAVKGIISDADAYAGCAIHDLSKENIKAAKKSHDKDLLVKARQELKNLRAENEKIEIAGFIAAELHRFESPVGKAQLSIARTVLSMERDRDSLIKSGYLYESVNQYITSDNEKEIRRMLKAEINRLKLSCAAVKRGAESSFDKSVFSKLFSADDENEKEIFDTVNKMKKAKEENDRSEISELKEQLRILSRRKADIRAELKKATKMNSDYERAAKPFTEAQKIINLSRDYASCHEIFSI